MESRISDILPEAVRLRRLGPWSGRYSMGEGEPEVVIERKQAGFVER